MFTKVFLKSILERAIKTFAQALGAVLLASGSGLINAEWVAVLSTAGMAALLSALTTVATYAVPSTDTSVG